MHDLDSFIEKPEDRLEEGWCGFTGHVVPRSPAHPEGVPEQYVMQPFDVKPSYNGKSWLTVPLEIGHDEIGGADEAEYGLADDVAALFEAVGFLAPGPSPLMPLHHQIAQKLNALSAPGSDRAHDLIDLQVICQMGDVDLRRTRETCLRLFDYRRQQAWPRRSSRPRTGRGFTVRRQAVLTCRPLPGIPSRGPTSWWPRSMRPDSLQGAQKLELTRM